MNNRFVSLLLIIAVLLCCFVGCKKEQETIPEEAKMRAIFELATMDCYYHNVAKFEQKDAEGFLWWKKDARFWIEYAGIVRLGIDVSKVKIKIEEDKVIISIPPAEVQGCKVDDTTLNEDSFYIDANSAKVDADMQQAAFDEAQKMMEETAKSDKALLTNAQQRAQDLLEDYVTNIGNAVGKQYTIEWIYLEAEGGLQESSVPEQEYSELSQ